MSVILTVHQFRKEEVRRLHNIAHGAVFIYPTDTIYGIGCDATNDVAVRRVREIKKREDKPFSVIAPSKEWITENCSVPAAGKEWLAKLPGPYTLILKLKKNRVAHSVNNGMETLGVRIPDHWIAGVAAKLEKPIVTTSVNHANQAFATSVAEIPVEILDEVDFVIDEHRKEGRPSTIVDLTGKEPVIKTR